MTIFGPMLSPNVQILIDEIFLNWLMAISRADLFVFLLLHDHEKFDDGYITLEFGLFVNLLIFNYFRCFEVRLRCV